jgi:hypothetical protein
VLSYYEIDGATTLKIPCLQSSAMTPAADGGFNPSGKGVHGFARASLITASRISFGGGKSQGLLQAAAPAAALISAAESGCSLVWYIAPGVMVDSSMKKVSLVMPAGVIIICAMPGEAEGGDEDAYGGALKTGEGTPGGSEEE